MKHKNFFKTAFTLLLSGAISMATAADIYVSNGAGNDTNDGLSAATPVKTISKAFTICLAGDVIHIMDMININQEPIKPSSTRPNIDITGLSTLDANLYTVNGVTYTTWNVAGNLGIIPHTRSITIIGDDKASCGFDGNNASCIIRHDHGSIAGTVITYKNLTFQNGKSNDQSGGGGVYFRGSTFSTAVFENCDFKNNIGNQNASTLRPGGGLSIVHGTASLKNCSFTGNTANKGGALYIQAGNVVMDSCVFENNDLSATAGTWGGAIYAYPTSTTAGPLNLEIKNSLFKNNKAESQGGAVWIGETVAMPSNLKFLNCAFVDNSTINGTATGTNGMGGAIYINNVIADAVSKTAFINTTFKGNQAGSTTGGVFLVNGLLVNSTLDLINCTVSGNQVAGTTGATGAGIRFLKGASAGIRTIKNCIIENNTAIDANMSSAADYADLGMENNVDPITLVETPSYVAGTTLIIEKSLIGTCNNADFSTQFPNNKSNYVFELNGSIANSYKAKLGEFDEEENYFPLLAGSEAIAYGNSAFLVDLTPSVTTDQIGRNRPATACSAGAYEFETISGVKTTVNNSIAVYRNANNQLTVINDEEVISAGTITVCNMMGQIIMSTPMTGSITTINKELTSGVYLVLVNINGNVSSKKVMLK